MNAAESLKIDRKKAGFFRFKELDGDYLLTNDNGEYIFLNRDNFRSYLDGGLNNQSETYRELQQGGFIRDDLDFEKTARKYALKNIHLDRGANLHIVIVTLRCDHKCIYCQAGSQDLETSGFDMDRDTAERVVDCIFDSPNPEINIEFQGGEPLVNFDAIKHITEYALEKNKIDKRELRFSMVTNLALMNDAIMDFIKKHNFGICISLDGDEHLHNAQRPSKIVNSYKNTQKWLKILLDEFRSNKIKSMPQALLTVTGRSLKYPEEIVDAYINSGLAGIHLRPANPFGVKTTVWEKIKFSPGEFIEFYIKSLDYILSLNLKGSRFYERTAKIIVSKIFDETDPGYLDLRSPCGAGTGQIAYNYNGDVYSCDEARMLSMMGDETFRLGNLNDGRYKDFINNDVVKTLVISSCLDNLPSCSDCVYKPYCGVCPIYNYYTEGDVFSRQVCNDRCAILKGIFDYLFRRLREPQIKEVFLKWKNA